MAHKFLSTPANTVPSPPSLASGHSGRGPAEEDNRHSERHRRYGAGGGQEAEGEARSDNGTLTPPPDEKSKQEFSYGREGFGTNGVAIGALDNGLLTPQSFRVTIPSVDFRLRQVLDMDVTPPGISSVGQASVVRTVRDEDERPRVSGGLGDLKKERSRRDERARRLLYSPSTVDGDSASELQSLDSFGLTEDDEGLYGDEEPEDDDDDGMSTTTLQSSRRATYGAKTMTATNRTDGANTIRDDNDYTDGTETGVGYRIPRAAKGKWKAQAEQQSELDDSVAEVDLQDLLSPMPKYVMLPAQRALDSPAEPKVQHRRSSSDAAKEEVEKDLKTKVKVRIESHHHHHHHQRRSSRGTPIVYEKGISRDFFLIMALCLGLACAAIVLFRPLMMAWVGSRESLEFGILEFE